MQRVTTSDQAELEAEGREFALGTAQVGQQKSEVYVDRIAESLTQAYGESVTQNPVLMGFAIGNVGAHETGHNLGKHNKELKGPIDPGKPNRDIMVVPMTPATMIRNTTGFVD